MRKKGAAFDEKNTLLTVMCAPLTFLSFVYWSFHHLFEQNPLTCVHAQLLGSAEHAITLWENWVNATPKGATMKLGLNKRPACGLYCMHECLCVRAWGGRCNVKWEWKKDGGTAGEIITLPF